MNYRKLFSLQTLSKDDLRYLTHLKRHKSLKGDNTLHPMAIGYVNVMLSIIIFLRFLP